MSWALVPVKCLSKSKRRLGGVLCPEEYEGLMLAMPRDVLTAISRHDLRRLLSDVPVSLTYEFLNDSGIAAR
jgi:2-phospho-L-lactate guanylyltransferase (CobY/MobA/RfbA family)